MPGRLPSVMSHRFSTVPGPEIPRSSFDRSHGYKTTFDAGYLVPIFIDEALPGDTCSLRMTAFGRLATPVFPIMDNIFADTFFFAVPLRLLWENWERFNGEQDNPDDTTDYTIPQMVSPASGGYVAGSLSDYFGIPTEIESLSHSALWHRAYNLIWNRWFRDQNLQDSVTVDIDDGPDNPADYVLLKRGKRHDYFTASLPWPQKGPAVTIPIGGTAPVNYVNTNTEGWFARNASTGAKHTGSNLRLDGMQFRSADGELEKISDGTEYQLDPNGNLEADLASATAQTINTLRQAFQIQKLYERDARGGTRYKEIILSHFGVVSDDARLDYPEYLGGGSTPINISPVAQTSSTDVTSPQGNLAAMGTLSINGHGFTKSFTEHCVVIGLACIRADLNYQQGLDRMWSRSTRWDFYWPTLAHLGEQAVLNKEIYAQGAADPTADADVFGYQERFAEYRYKRSQITGQFRSNHATTLDAWHLAQDFSALPVLNDAFIQEDPPIDRVIAVPSEPHILWDSFFSYRCARPMPVYSVPGLIDHF